METIDYWTPLWNALYRNGASAKSEDATHRFWLSLPPEQQASVSLTIVRKVAAGDFVWYNPIRAIQENMRRTLPQPHFLSGTEQDELRKRGVPMVQVKYDNKFLICTLKTADDFQLDKQRYW